jgi:hypothetical protein
MINEKKRISIGRKSGAGTFRGVSLFMVCLGIVIYLLYLMFSESYTSHGFLASIIIIGVIGFFSGLNVYRLISRKMFPIEIDDDHLIIHEPHQSIFIELKDIIQSQPIPYHLPTLTGHGDVLIVTKDQGYRVHHIEECERVCQVIMNGVHQKKGKIS